MNAPLATLGIVFLAAAAIGGGLRASGYEVKPITSVGARIGLGMIGGLALVLGIIAGSLDTKPEPPVTAPTTPAPQEPSTSTTPSTPAAAALSPASPPASPPKTSVFWSGQITLDEYADVRSARLRDLDIAPPKTSQDDGDIGAGDIENDSVEGAFGYLVAPTGAHTLAEWPGTAAPTRKQCREAAVASGSETIRMSQGGYACVQTSQGRTALLKVTKLIGDQSLQAIVTVWDDVES